MTTLPPLGLAGIGLWSPMLQGWDTAMAVLEGRSDAPANPQSRPTPALLAPAERRRAPDTVALALEVAQAACKAAGLNPRDLPSVFASRYGDLPICDAMCATLATTPALCSPIKFHNSVHNAAAGYWTAATQCHCPATALLAGRHTFAAGLLAAMTQALAEETPVLLVAYDVEARGPLAEMIESEGLLALALVLDPSPDGRQSRLVASMQPGSAVPDPPLPGQWEHRVPRNSMRAGLPLLAAAHANLPSRVGWALGTNLNLLIELQPADGATD